MSGGADLTMRKSFVTEALSFLDDRCDSVAGLEIELFKFFVYPSWRAPLLPANRHVERGASSFIGSTIDLSEIIQHAPQTINQLDGRDVLAVYSE